MKPELTSAPRTDPTLIYRYRDALYAADLLIVGLQLDFFSWLGAHPSTLGAVCAAHGFAARPADVMLTLFSAMGLIHHRDGVFTLTEAGREHLIKGSPWYLGPYYPTLEDRPIARDLLEVLRTGKPANWATHEAGKDWHQAMESEEFAASFTAAMDCRGLYLGAVACRRRRPAAASPSARHRRRLRRLRLRPGRPQSAPAGDGPRQAAGRPDRGGGDREAGSRRPRVGARLRHARRSAARRRRRPPVLERAARLGRAGGRAAPAQVLRCACPRVAMVIVHEAFLNAEKTGPLHVASIRCCSCTRRKAGATPSRRWRRTWLPPGLSSAPTCPAPPRAAS